MKRLLACLTGLGLLALFLALFPVGPALAQPSVASTSWRTYGAWTNFPAPSFAGVTLDGNQVSLQSYHGKPLVLLFWSSG